MTDRPILFSAPMIRALLAGMKTQTRRVMKPQFEKIISPGSEKFVVKVGGMAELRKHKVFAGDRLWVRETWSGTHEFRDTPPAQRQNCMTPDGLILREDVHFWADGNPLGGDYEKPRPGIHMPRWASRLTLIVTDVRVERLQDISEADAKAEGVEQDSDGWRDYLMPATQCCATAKDSYQTLWDSINGPGAWDTNPWVVAYSFNVLRGNIDSLERRAA